MDYWIRYKFSFRSDDETDGDEGSGAGKWLGLLRRCWAMSDADW